MITAAAIIGAGALSAGASAFGASEQAGAATNASQAQLQATQESIAAQKYFFNQEKGELQPFVNEGTGASGELNSLLGLNPSGAAGAQQTLENLPGYKFTLGQAEQAQSTGITARGLGLSGAQTRGAADYASGVASQNYNSYVGNLFNLLGLGENAAAGVGTGAIATGAGVGNAAVQGGNAIAAGDIGSATAIAGGFSGVGSAFGNAASQYAGYNTYQNIINGGGGGSGGSASSWDNGSGP